MSRLTWHHHRIKEGSEVLQQPTGTDIIQGYKDHWSKELLNTPSVKFLI